MSDETFAGEPLDPYVLKDEITRLRAALAAVTEERDRMREALRPFASPPLYVFDRPLKYVPAPMTEDWIGGGWFCTEDFRRARAAIEGVTEPASPWRDIESAPKNGTDFLALIPYNQKHHQMVGCFAPEGKFRSWPSRHEYRPTHWMPLPEPPTGDSNA